MVLQRGKPNPVWGQGAAAGAEVTVELLDPAKGRQVAAASARADARGHWRVKLPMGPEAITTPHTLKISSGNNFVALADVLVGDVWLCAGQSNLTHGVAHNANTDASKPWSHKSNIGWVLPDPKPAVDSGIRHFGLEKKAPADFDTPRDEFLNERDGDPYVENVWKRAEPEIAGEFTAIGFYFARAWREAKLRAGENVPVGLVRVGWGGTVTETWMSKESLLSRPDFAAKRRELAGSGTTTERQRANRPSACFNTRVHPLAGLALHGVIWSQGESNSGQYALFHAELSVMIANWRELFENPQLPFVIMQTPSIPRSSKTGEAQVYPWLRVAQAAVARTMPNAYIVSTLPLGALSPTPSNTDLEIHCRTKHLIAPHAALVVRKNLDGEKILAEGPRVKEVTVKGNKIVAKFETDGAGLATDDKLPPRGFEIAGEDGVYQKPDTVGIDGDSVELASDKVPSPAAVRYGWSNQGHAISEKSAPEADEYPPTANMATRQVADIGVQLPMQPFRWETKRVGKIIAEENFTDAFDKSPWDANVFERTIGLRRLAGGEIERTRDIASECITYRFEKPVVDFSIVTKLSHKVPVLEPDPRRIYVSVSNDGKNWSLPLPPAMSWKPEGKASTYDVKGAPPRGLLDKKPTWLRVTIVGSAVTKAEQTRLVSVNVLTSTTREAAAYPWKNAVLNEGIREKAEVPAALEKSADKLPEIDAGRMKDAVYRAGKSDDLDNLSRANFAEGLARVTTGAFDGDAGRVMPMKVGETGILIYRVAGVSAVKLKIYHYGQKARETVKLSVSNDGKNWTAARLDYGKSESVSEKKGWFRSWAKSAAGAMDDARFARVEMEGGKATWLASLGEVVFE